MAQKLFQTTVALLLVIVSVVFFALLLTGLVSVLRPQESAGIYAFSVSFAAVSLRRLYFLVLAAAFLVVGFCLLWRRRRFRR